MKDIEWKKEKLKTVIEELKQGMLAKSAKVRRYQQNFEKFRQRRIFLFWSTYNSMEMGWDQVMHQMMNEVKDFGGDI